MYLLTSLLTKADATPSTSISVASVSFPRLETLTLTVLTHAASSMQVARLMVCLLIIKLNMPGSCRLKDYYATFAVPYNGEDNNDYVDGKGFCCNDGSLEAAQARALARQVSKISNNG